MAFAKSEVSVPCVLEPGSCQAVRIHTTLDGPIARVAPTSEWLAENEAKQAAYAAKRAEWRKLVGSAETNMK